MIAILVVVGLAIPPLTLMWQDLSYRSARATAISQATFYAQELMEEIKSKRFDDPDEPTVTALGPNSETYPNFDDVDDFNGCTDSRVTTPAGGYARSANIDYVSLNTDTDPDSWEASGSPTDYKRIDVSVSHRFADSSLVTIVSAY